MLLSIIFMLILSSCGTSAISRKTESAMIQQLHLIRHKITNLEVNLYHVLSKVVFLSDADVHQPRKNRQPDKYDRSEIKQEQGQKLYDQELRKSLKHMETLLEQIVATQICAENKTIENILVEKEQKRNQEKDQMDPIYQPAKAGCSELDDRLDGIYRFLVPELNEIDRNFNERFCTFATDGPAWTVIQNRGSLSFQNYYENFNRNWDEYRAGFGNLSKDFWFGNEFLHKIVYRDDHVLRIELEDQKGVREWAEYGLFRLDSEMYNYQLTVDEFQGSLADGLEYHNKMDFSTFDHGTIKGEFCALNSSSGWWFDSCQETNLNGNARVGGIIWANWHNLTRSRMLIRPRQNTLVEDDIEEL